MGSFNASCAVSHCSINPGDPVKLIAIVSNTPTHDMYDFDMHKGFACYCHDQFSMIGYPMDATYEDYGNFDVKEDMFSEYTLNVIRKNYTQNVPDKEDEESPSSISDSRNGYSVGAEDLDWEQIGEMIHFGNMYLDSNKERTKRRYMGFFPVHKCVYDLLMQRTPEMYLGEDYGNFTFHEFLEKHIEKHQQINDKEVYDATVTKFMEMFGPIIGTTLKDGSLMTPELAHEKAVDMAEMEIEMKSMREESRREYSYTNSTDIKHFLKYHRSTQQPELTPEEHIALVTLDAQCTYFVRGLNDLQIQLIPPMTAGQEYDKTDHAAFMIAAGAALLSMQHENDEDRYDEDDDDEDEEEDSYKVEVSAVIHVSLNRLRIEANCDWKKERGQKRVDAIDKFVVQYPHGATLSANEIISQGYGILLTNMPSTILPLVIKNDIKVEE